MLLRIHGWLQLCVKICMVLILCRSNTAQFFSATKALTSDEPSRTALERACFKVPTRSSFRNAVMKIADSK